MTTSTLDTLAILSWFSGKSLTNAKAALCDLIISLDQGFWREGTSRSARAALTKPNVAAKFVKANLEVFKSLNDRCQYTGAVVDYGSGSSLARELRYGCYVRAMEHLPKCESFATTTEQKDVLKTVRTALIALEPVAQAMTKLDNTRPKPVFTSIGVSPTITRTLAELGVSAASGPDAITVCPMEFKLVEYAPGKFKHVCKLLWPEGTVHGCSKYSHSNNLNLQCHSCGHAIKNGFNWLPLVVKGADGKIMSLWVGRDCGKRLFGVDMKGEIELQEGTSRV